VSTAASSISQTALNRSSGRAQAAGHQQRNLGRHAILARPVGVTSEQRTWQSDRKGEFWVGGSADSRSSRPRFRRLAVRRGGDAGNGPLSYAGFEGAVVAIYNDGPWQATCAAP